MKKSRISAAAILLACSLYQGVCYAADWSEYRGPNHDGITSESINTAWPQGGLKPLWTAPTPNGFSSFAVGGGEAFTIVGRDGKEECIALDGKTGKELWSIPTDAMKYQGGGDSGTPDNKGGDGPRSTPAYADGKVYGYTSDLVLYCLDAKTGRKDWIIDMEKEHGGKNISWSNASSPVIDGELLFVAAGGPGQSFLGIDRKSGKVVWKSGTESITHATPVVADILGTRQVIFFVQSGLVSLSPTTGKQLWKFPFKYSTSTAASPVVCGDIVYCSAGYGVGGGAAKITKSGSEFAATEMWKISGNGEVANHWSTPVYKDGYLYGMFSFKRFGVGPLKCVEVATGKVVWTKDGFGAGQVIMAKDKLIALADNGEVVIVDPTPDSYKEVARMKAVSGKCWSTPALSDGHLYVRSTKEAACFDVSAK
ncbi:MAG TPA: PQQ-binding-like beta-propeller repeat protein [Tepidisphaeraceae bacterium]|jgi:outer membrane protein assembly factor BamB|nr:PQQ-binding-like beta-propeller repeat protein [Tepidisphaeraceae bacterium]